MWKRWLMGSLVLATSYMITFLLLTWIRPLFSQPANAVGGVGAVGGSEDAALACWYLDLRQHPDVDYRLTATWAKIKTALEAKEAAIAYLKQVAEFRQALEDLRKRISTNPGVPQLLLPGFCSGEDSLYRAMVVVIDLLVVQERRNDSDLAEDISYSYHWLVRVLAPYRLKGLLSPADECPECIAPTLQELLINAKTGSVRPVIPWDRWAKPDTGKLYPPRIPERIRRKYNLPDVWVPPPPHPDPNGDMLPTRAKPGSNVRPRIPAETAPRIPEGTAPVKQP